ncbi:STAS/SEC14 domain-containing protein [Alkalibacterium putridalgicola]|uniref:STAS/SEC14 domain-containing protein n=1 Tax=Alkalibacterium putridalgicola TaxID=426703 RepID=UPI0034CF3ED1
MMIRTNDLPYVIEVEIDGEVTEEDIKDFEAYFKQKKENLINKDKLNLLMEIRSLNYTIDGLIKDIKFDTSHLDDFDKVAMVSDKKWAEIGEKLVKYMPQVEVRQFDPEEKEQAKVWVS